MNRKFVIIFIAIIGLAGVLISFSSRSIVLKRGTRLMEKSDSESKKSLLALADDYEKKGEYLKAGNTLKAFTRRFPDSEDAAKTQNKTQELNIKVLFSDVQTKDSLLYQIKAGDTLAGIASRFNTTVELIKRENNLKSDLIMPGKFLKVNKVKFSIMVDKSENVLTLKKYDGEIVKAYTVSTGENLSTPTGTFKIEEKLISPVWYKVGAVVEPGSSEYELGSRWMGLSVSGYGIHGTNDASSIGKHVTKGCVRMANEDIEELYVIVPSGTEVVIVE